MQALAGPALGNDELDDRYDAIANVHRRPHLTVSALTGPIHGFSDDTIGTVSIVRDIA